jgi:hypothetical protein
MNQQQQQEESGLFDNIKSGMNNIGDKIRTSGEDITNKIGDLGTSAKMTADNTSTTIGNGLDAIKSVLPPAPTPSNGVSFSLSDYTSMSSEFLESNSYIARAAFILLVVFTFFVILRLVTGLINYFIGRSADPTKLIDGLIGDATQAQTFTQGGINTIFRSNNESNGVEFTWAVSLYIKDADQTVNPIYSHVFSKGSVPTLPDETVSGKRNKITTINQAPGLYLKNSDNSLVVKMDTFNGTDEIIIHNIPHNKWLNVVIRCKNTLLDVYINGQIANSKTLSGVPKQNYGNVYASSSGGFAGSMSNLWYYKHALTINEIQALMKHSVNLELTNASGTVNSTKTDYLGFSWFTK